MHSPKSKGRRLVDLGWEELHRVRREGMLAEVSSTSKRIIPRRKCSKCRFSKSSSLKAMKKQTSEQKRERWWTEELGRR